MGLESVLSYILLHASQLQLSAKLGLAISPCNTNLVSPQGHNCNYVTWSRLRHLDDTERTRHIDDIDGIPIVPLSTHNTDIWYRQLTSYISSTTYAAGGLSLFPHRFPFLSISHIAFTVFYHRTRPDEIYPVHVLHLSEPKPRSSVGRPHAALPITLRS